MSNNILRIDPKTPPLDEKTGLFSKNVFRFLAMIGMRAQFIGEDTQSTVGAAGGASALPATPVGYHTVQIDGNEYVIPYYNK